MPKRINYTLTAEQERELSSALKTDKRAEVRQACNSDTDAESGSQTTSGG